MASKKFSRLSIMLEAQDGMSKPMQNATRASQQLQSGIKSLNGTLGQTGEGTNKFTSAIKNAQQSTVNFANVLYEFAKNSAVAYTASLALAKVWTTLKDVALNVSTAIKDFVTSTKSFQMAAAVVNKITTSVKQFAVSSKLAFDIWKNSVIAPKIEALSNGVKKLSADTIDLVKNTKAFQLAGTAIDSVKSKVVATSLAFTLWKNNSVFLEKLSNDFSKIKNAASTVGNAIKGLISNFSLLRRNSQSADNSLNKLGSRRATFNQLASANAKLNAQLEKMNRQLERSEGLFSKMRKGIGDIASIEKLRMGFEVGRGIVDTGKEYMGEALKNAAEQDYNKRSFGIIIGDQKKANQYYDYVQQYASTTAYGANDWAGNLRGVIRKAKNTDQLKTYMNTMEQLATLDPEQGLEGAAFAMRELASGNINSMANRFELNKAYLKPMKNITDPMEQAKMLSDMLGKQYGYSVNQINQMKETPQMQMQAFQNHVKQGMGNMASGMLTQITPELAQFNKMFNDGKFTKFFSTISTGLGNATKGVMAFFRSMIEGLNSGSIQSKMQPFINLFNQIKGTMAKAWPDIRATFVNIGTIVSNVANEISNIWPKVEPVLLKGFSIIRKVSDAIVNNWGASISVVTGLVAAIAGFKVLSTIAVAWTAVTKALAAFREIGILAAIAQWALNTALLANPFVLVAALVIGLGVALYTAYQRSETFRNGVLSAWASIKSAFIDGVNSAIGSINKLIDYMDKIPGVNIGHIDQIDNTAKQAQTIYGPKQVPNMSFKNVVNSDKRNGLPNLSFSSFGHSHRGGLDRVPYDGYKAVLHKDERVQTAQQRKDDDNEKRGVLVTGNTFYVRKESDIDAIAESLVNKLYAAKTQMG